jgi:hypothetical protein
MEISNKIYDGKKQGSELSGGELQGGVSFGTSSRLQHPI